MNCLVLKYQVKNKHNVKHWCIQIKYNSQIVYKGKKKYQNKSREDRNSSNEVVTKKCIIMPELPVKPRGVNAKKWTVLLRELSYQSKLEFKTTTTCYIISYPRNHEWNVKPRYSKQCVKQKCVEPRDFKACMDELLRLKISKNEWWKRQA